MKRWVWMNGWDVDLPDPAAIIENLRESGLTGCSMGLSYHGGRMLLGRHPHRVVYRQHPGALYFQAQPDRFPQSLRPAVALEAESVTSFLETCGRAGFDAQAWLVLCHNDALGSEAADCCVENAFGERYEYALCPANPAVQDYCVELCRQAAATPGVTGLDLEALGWLGYEHQGLHEKRGFPLPSEAAWWLSICCCPYCRKGTGDLRSAIRERVRGWLAAPRQPAPAGFDEVLEWRAIVQLSLLRRIRETLPETRLNVRLSQEQRWSGGKCTLPLSKLRGLANEATVTFFGAKEAAISAGLQNLPIDPTLPVNAGFVFHGPDCDGEEDVLRRLRLLSAARLNGWGFYSYGMAFEEHWNWLRRSLAVLLSELPQSEAGESE